MVSKITRILWWGLLISLLLAGVISLVIFLPSFPTAKAALDNFAKDGSLESFNAALYQAVKWPMRFAGVVMILSGVMGLWKRSASQAALGSLIQTIGGLGVRAAGDTRRLYQKYQPRKENLSIYITLGGITIFALLTRIVFISRPMRHDESYSFITFASLPFRYAISDYTLPNNHIFHTALVNLTTRLLGIHPWAVRLPAAAAGTLVAPLGYLFARRKYDRHAALLGAALIAAYPLLIKYSTSARGYSVITFFSLAIFVCANFLKEEKNLAVWLLFILCSALGFFTIPIMLYPVGVVYSWLLLSALRNDMGLTYRSRAEMLKYLVFSGMAILLLTALFYLPAIRYSGLKAVLGNNYIVRSNWSDYTQILASRWFDLKKEWNLDIPALGSIFLVSGFVLSILLNGRITADQVPVQAATLLFIAAELAIHRPNPWSRIWQPFLPLYLIWAAAGWLGPLNRLTQQRDWKVNPAQIAALAAVALLAGASILRSFSYYPTLRPQPEEVEQTVLFLKDQIGDEDVVLLEPPRDVPIEYYARLYAIPPHVFNRARPFRRAFIIVDGASKQTLDSVLAYNGSETFFFLLDTLQQIGQFKLLDIYLCDSNWELVQQEFNK